MSELPTVLLSPVEADQVRAAPTPLAALIAWRDERAEFECGAGARMFMGKPDRWFESPHWRCVTGHVSTRFLKSEQRGDLCLACQEPVVLTFPEDYETDPPTPVGKRPGVVTLTVEGDSWLDIDFPTKGEYRQRMEPPSRWAFDEQRVTLTVECPECGGKGWETCAEGAERCEACREVGTVPLATAIVRVEPGDGTHWNVVLDEIEVAG